MHFTLEPAEKKKLDEWLAEHETKTGHVSAYAGAIGGSFTYSFTPTSIGVVSEVECGFCHEKCNLTDFDSW